MMVLFVSQCQKRAKKRSRRVLDTFAERIGDDTWLTLITDEGLKAVRGLLRRSASKSTAVSCHRIRGYNSSELLWIVGNRDKFDERGRVPVHMTTKPLLQLYSEHDWRYIGLLQSLTVVAGLLHDWGKANDAFQKKLTERKAISDPLRHEWVSAMLLGAFVAIDPQTWLKRLYDGRIDKKAILDGIKGFELKAFGEFPLSAQAVAWLILTHHKLPTPYFRAKELAEEYSGEILEGFAEFFAYVDADWGYSYEGDIDRVTSFSKGLLEEATDWKKRLSRWAKKLDSYQELLDELAINGALRALLHHARVALMLGDYGYSSDEAREGWHDCCGLYANTKRDGTLKQRLDEHLCGVADLAKVATYRFLHYERELPRAHDIKKLLKASPAPFAWQDKAAMTVWEHYGKRGLQEGFFGIDMASTGKGKTVANAKIMHSLRRDRSLRYVLALGLRTLTLQTAEEYRNRLRMDEEQVAEVIGSRAIGELYGESEDRDKDRLFSGSESAERLWSDWISWERAVGGRMDEIILKEEKAKNLLYAPVLVCTIDHMMGAVDTVRGGAHLLPALRLMGSDLVIDEIDDFVGADLIAIGRLLFLVGMLGRRVMLSSATIPPDLAEGFFHAYAQGWRHYSRFKEGVADRVHAFWADEFGAKIEALPNDAKVCENYRICHADFVRRRLKKLRKFPARRKAEIVALGEKERGGEAEYFETMLSAILRLHERHHIVDPESGKRVSFGVVRMANIGPCVDFAKYLCYAQCSGADLKIMPYHSRQVLLLRHAQERYLDTILKRKEGPEETPKALEDAVVRRHIGGATTRNVLFVVLATPIEEVGRDHDFDWALIEPSSWRSVIQMAGRVLRHREMEPKSPNIAIMQYNYRAYVEHRKIAFTRPGFEDEEHRLETHDMQKLIDTQSICERLDASWRIVKAQKLDERRRLVDLEHSVIAQALTGYDNCGPESLEGYLSGDWYLTALPQIANAFRLSQKEITLYLVYDDRRERYFFAELDEDDSIVDRERILNIEWENLDISMRRRLWLQHDYDTLVQEQSRLRGWGANKVRLRFGELKIPAYADGYRYSYVFGAVLSDDE